MFDFITNAWENVRDFMVSVPDAVMDLPLPWLVVGAYALVTISSITVVIVRVESRRIK